MISEKDNQHAVMRNQSHGWDLSSDPRLCSRDGGARDTALLFISGTMGLDETGKAGGSLDEQLNLIWSNLRRILAEADMTVDNIMRQTSYLRDPSFAEQNQDARVAALGGRRIPTTTIAVQTLIEDWLVEIEIIAVA
jgi:2-iminobutanoate/2-iminopropanoate deaminase